MKNEVLYLLLNNYADHEAVFLASAIACDERSIKENPKYTNKVVAPTLDVVRSCSGFHTLPDYSFETMPNDYAALVLIGGFGWLDELEADKVVPIVRRAIKKGIIVGAICNAASFLAKHGFLNEIKHTGNGLEQLQLWGGERRGILRFPLILDTFDICPCFHKRHQALKWGLWFVYRQK